MSNLRLIKQSSLTTAVSSFNVTDVFNDDFDIYKVQINGVSTDGTTYGDTSLRLINSSGSLLSDSNYCYGYNFMAPNTSYTSEYSTSSTSFYRALAYFTDQAPETQFATFYFYNPARSSCYTYIGGQSGAAYGGIFRFNKYFGIYKSNASATGIQISASQSISSGDIKIYGLGVDT